MTDAATIPAAAPPGIRRAATRLRASVDAAAARLPLWPTLVLVSVATLVVQLPGPHATAWHWFDDAGGLLLGGGPAGSAGGLHLYGDNPGFQFGPLSIVVAIPFTLLGAEVGSWAAMGVASAAGLVALALLLDAAEHLRPGIRRQLPPAVVLVGGVVAIVTWGDVAVRTAHIDDAVALLALAAAVRWCALSVSASTHRQLPHLAGSGGVAASEAQADGHDVAAPDGAARDESRAGGWSPSWAFGVTAAQADGHDLAAPGGAARDESRAGGWSPSWAFGVTAALAIAAAAKPWAIMFAPLALVPSAPPRPARPRRRWGWVSDVGAAIVAPGWGRLARVGVVGAVALLTWAPFVLAEPETLDTARYGIENDPTSVLRALGVDDPTTPGWARPAQLLGGTALVGLLVVRGRWPMALLAGVAWRLLLDPAANRYYTIGFVLGALLVELNVRRGRLPWATLAAAITLELTAMPGIPALPGRLLRLTTVALALALAVGLVPARGSPGRDRGQPHAPPDRARPADATLGRKPV